MAPSIHAQRLGSIPGGSIPPQPGGEKVKKVQARTEPMHKVARELPANRSFHEPIAVS